MSSVPKNVLKNYSKNSAVLVLMLSLTLHNAVAAENTARVVAGPDIGQVIMALVFVLVLVFALAFFNKIPTCHAL